MAYFPKALICAFAVIGAPALLLAQSASYNAPVPQDRSSYFSAADLQKIRDSIPSAPDGGPGQFSKRLFTASTYSNSFIRITKPDTPHAHGMWSEVFVVQEGDAVLETNGDITGITGHDSATHRDMFVDKAPPPDMSAAAQARRAAQGDKAGTAIDGGTRQHVGPGDVILIPAGVPHRWVQVDRPVVYFDIKFPKAN
jgi:mannose-6-phosphate isomerase-like protein (cupin superfamily)